MTACAARCPPTTATASSPPTSRPPQPWSRMDGSPTRRPRFAVRWSEGGPRHEPPRPSPTGPRAPGGSGGALALGRPAPRALGRTRCPRGLGAGRPPLALLRGSPGRPPAAPGRPRAALAASRRRPAPEDPPPVPRGPRAEGKRQVLRSGGRRLDRQAAMADVSAAPEVRVVRAPRGTALSCRSWQQEAALRMLMNNLDPEVAERPQDLVVYGGIGKAARNWACFDAIVAALTSLGDDESLLIQSGKPVGVFKTHADAPRVLIANSNIVPKWATWEHFNALDRKGLMMFGQMTAGSWIYIGSQGIVQGTYETFVEAGRQHYGGNLKGRWILTGGLGGMGGAQPLAATMAGASML